jgi:hypothetical protein
MISNQIREILTEKVYSMVSMLVIAHSGVDLYFRRHTQGLVIVSNPRISRNVSQAKQGINTHVPCQLMHRNIPSMDCSARSLRAPQVDRTALSGNRSSVCLFPSLIWGQLYAICRSSGEEKVVLCCTRVSTPLSACTNWACHSPCPTGQLNAVLAFRRFACF